jgi:type III secretion system low calcium response chaperone LcrH/SycD
MHYKQGKYQEAVGLFRILTMAHIKNRKYWMGLGAALQMQKEYGQAIEAYELAAALDPVDPRVHLHAADCFFAQKKRKEGLFALDCAERALKQQKVPDQNLSAHIKLIRQAWNKKED